MSDYWSDFCISFDFEGSTNFKTSFSKLCKRYGKAFREYIKLSYSVRDNISDEEFCHLNHLPDNLLIKWVA